MHVVGDEERGEAESLDDAEHAQQGDGVAQKKAGRGDDEQDDAERHEDAATDTVEPEADQRLAEDAGGAVHALDQPDLRLRASEALDVERQEDEAAEARHEDEVGEGRLREGPAGDELELADHGHCGPPSPRRKIAATMTRAAIARAQCSMRRD